MAEHPLVVGSRVPKNDTFFSEICDHCRQRIWVPPNLRDILDDADQYIEVLCLSCAVGIHGTVILDRMMEQTAWQEP